MGKSGIVQIPKQKCQFVSVIHKCLSLGDYHGTAGQRLSGRRVFPHHPLPHRLSLQAPEGTYSYYLSVFYLLCSVADPDADPDPTYHFDADPDPDF